MYKSSRRHLALVLNKDDDTIKFYLDGELAGTLSSEAGDVWIRDSTTFDTDGDGKGDYQGGGVGRLDCGLNTADGYTALGHRVALGGEKPYRGLVQDWRYYVGHALNATEIKAIATKSVDSVGKNLRTCTTRTEGMDSTFKDIYGHDCSWYQKRINKFPELCASDTVRNKCPVACSCRYGSPCPCYTAEEATTAKTYTIWDKLMPIRELDASLGTNGDSICVRSGLDVIAECLKNQANPQSFPVYGFTDYSTSDKVVDYSKPNTTRLASEGNGRWCNIPPGPPDDVCSNPKVWNCAVLQKAVNPFCSFRVDNDWSKTVHSEIKQNGGYTLSFWWKAMSNTKWDTINKGQMLFYSSVVPPRVLFALDFYGKGEGSNINYWMEAYSTCSPTFENFANIDGGQNFEVGLWYHVSIVFGAPDPTGTNTKYVMLMAGATPASIASSMCAYMPATEDLIQAITVPGGLLLTPIELTSRPMSVKELQSYYYNWDSKILLRKGPSSLDEDRAELEIEYVVPPAGFPHKMSLVAPPILLQTRRKRTSNCTYALGSEYNNKVWENAVDVTCQDPYVCPEELMTVPTSLMACSSPESDERFFGKNPTVRSGKEMYFEFLQSISDAPFLVRDDEPRSARAFIDSQTTYVNCLMVAYSPQYGIVSTINIMAELEADVRVDYEIQHYQSLEGDDYNTYRTVVIIAFVLSAIVLIEKAITIRYMIWEEEWPGFVVDMIIQVILPVLYFALRFTNISNSKKHILQTIGTEGLAGVPWSSRTVDLEEKIAAFFTSLDKLDQLNAIEKSMSIFYFVLCSLQLLRLIFQTSAHPRTAILIKTL
jgi:hypothetical protein